MGLQVTCNKVRITGKMRNLIDDEVRLFAQNEFYRAMSDYIPRGETGLAQMTVDITKDGVRFYSPYARFLYHGKVMVGDDTKRVWARKDERKHVIDKDLQYDKTIHPLATSYWDKPAMLAKGDKVARAIKDLIREKART